MILLRRALMALHGLAVAYAFGALVAWSPWPGDWWAIWRYLIATTAFIFAFVGWVSE